MVAMEERVSKLEGAYEQVDRRLGRIGDEIRDLRSDMNSRIEGLRGEMNGRIDETNRAIEGLRTEMNGQMEGLRGEMNRRMGSLETRLNAILISVIVVGGGVVGSLVTLILRTT